MEDVEHYDIPIYNFPYDEEEDDGETIRDNTELRVSLFSVIYQCSKVFLTILLVSPALRGYWLRRRSRNRRRVGSRKDLPLGYCRG
jgi:hypothetical protein